LAERFNKIPARSPTFSIEGPVAYLRLTLSSSAIILASVVFPSPGGP